jgi:hypothetical protein
MAFYRVRKAANQFSYFLRRFLIICKVFIRQPKIFIQAVDFLPEFCRGFSIDNRFANVPASASNKMPDVSNPLWTYFADHKTGPGVWKWNHYFEVYDRHFSKFRNQPVNFLEIGIYSGGSLPMWRSYFGDECRVYGVDIEEACRCYEADRIAVFIGDQQDRSFWERFSQAVPQIDVLVDDGGHTPEQQMVTLEEMLPRMPVGSIYVCEDTCGISNLFTAFATGLVHRLNADDGQITGVLGYTATGVQRAIHSIHFYPYMCVIEKHLNAPRTLEAPKHGTQWQPFL